MAFCYFNAIDLTVFSALKFGLIIYLLTNHLVNNWFKNLEIMKKVFSLLLVLGMIIFNYSHL